MGWGCDGLGCVSEVGENWGGGWISIYFDRRQLEKKFTIDVSDLRPWIAEFAVSAPLGWW